MCSDIVRLMHCRYIRVLSKCSKAAADWQLEFTKQVTNTFPNIFLHVTDPDGLNYIDISKCTILHAGSKSFSSFVDYFRTCSDVTRRLKIFLHFIICPDCPIAIA